MSAWQTISSAPNGEVVLTKIDDERGVRNEQSLKRLNHLWWYPDGSMYVYYTPTHWKPLSTASGTVGDADGLGSPANGDP